MNLLKKFFGVAVLLMAFAASAFGQAALTSTVLSSAVTSSSVTQIQVSSATGFTVNSTNVLIDNELMDVRVISGTTISVVRGYGGTRAVTHASGATVLVGLNKYFTAFPRSGSCTATNEAVLPVYNTAKSEAYDCKDGEWATYIRNEVVVAQFGPVAAATDSVFFIADGSYQVIGCTEIHSAAAGGASKLQVVKDTGTDAPGAGTNLLTNNTNAGFDLAATANTLQTGTLTATAATKKLAAGNRLSVDFADAIQSSTGVFVSCTLKRQ